MTKAGTALQEIASHVESINGDIIAIVEASREQSTALSEINRAINTVDQGTQQNTAMVEEQTAASHELAREAAALFELLDQFRFEEVGRLQPAKHTDTKQHEVIKAATSTLYRSPLVRASGVMAPRGTANASAATAPQVSWEEF